MTIISSEGSVKAYDNDSEQFASVVKFECRGIEPVDFSPRTGQICLGTFLRLFQQCHTPENR